MTNGFTGDAAGAPDVFFVPHTAIPLFSGRDSLLQELFDDLKSSGDPGKHVQAIYGMGGVGKTQIAAEFAHRYREYFKVVFWIRAEEIATVWFDFAVLGRALGLPLGVDAPLETIRLETLAHLAGRDDYLLVFDNATSPAAIREFLPTPCRGGVLITSRNPNWGSVARSNPVHGLTRDESVQFLRKRTRRLEPETSARKLAQALGDLPLALEQAGALIQNARISFAEYLARFEAHWAELLKLQRPGGDYPDSVAMTWELSLRQVEEENPSALRLMNLLAFLSPDGVPRDLLSRNFQHLPEDLSMTVSDALSLDRALGSLTQYSLARVHDERDEAGAAASGGRQVISMHRLVGALARDRLTDDERRRWANAAARLTSAAFVFDSGDASTWSGAAAVLPHALVAAHYAQATGVPVEITCGLLDQAGRYLNRFAQYDRAKVLLDQALAISRRAYGDESPKVSAIANNLGRVLARLGQRELAQQHFEWAMAIDRNAYGDGDPHVATVMNNYALVLHATGELEAARSHLESALLIFETTYGETHPKVATLLNNLGYVHHVAGDDQSAHDLYQRALAIAEATLGARHPTVGSIAYNLGRSLAKLGHPLVARDYLERALAVDAGAYGETHPDVARDCMGLAAVLRQLGEAAAAERYAARGAAVEQAIASSAAEATEPLAGIES